MKFAKKAIMLAATAAMFGSSASNLQADDCCADNAGCGFDQCCASSSLVPAIALGTIAVIAIVAMATQDSGGHHHHSHSH